MFFRIHSWLLWPPPLVWFFYPRILHNMESKFTMWWNLPPAHFYKTQTKVSHIHLFRTTPVIHSSAETSRDLVKNTHFLPVPGAYVFRSGISAVFPRFFGAQEQRRSQAGSGGEVYWAYYVRKRASLLGVKDEELGHLGLLPWCFTAPESTSIFSPVSHLHLGLAPLSASPSFVRVFLLLLSLLTGSSPSCSYHLLPHNVVSWKLQLAYGLLWLLLYFTCLLFLHPFSLGSHSPMLSFLKPSSQEWEPIGPARSRFVTPRSGYTWV